MKKKNLLIVIVIVVIILLTLLLVFRVTKKEDNGEYLMERIINNSWIKAEHEYMMNKPIDDFIDPIENDSMKFNDDTVEFCYTPKSSRRNNKIEQKTTCNTYNYSIDKDKIVIIKDNVELVYTYEFNTDGQLLLSHSGDGFKIDYYYYRDRK